MADPLELPLALHREIAILQEDLGPRGDARAFRAHLDNLPALLGELIVAGELDPAVFQLDIPFTMGRGPLEDAAQVAAIRERADRFAADFLREERQDRAASRATRAKYLKLIDPRLAENDAVEVLVPHAADSARFARAEQALRKLNHRNVIRRYARLRDPVLGPCLLLEHVEGKSLEAILQRRKERGEPPLPLAAVAHLFLQAAQALSHVHGQGLVHGDVRPANFVNERQKDARPGRPQGVVKLGGFGAGEPPRAALLFFAPEQLSGGVATAATDVYQLGVTLFALTTGAVPYSNLPADEFPLKLLAAGPHPTRVHHLRADISPRLEAVIEGAREKDPGKRWPMAQVLEEISQIYAAREFTVKDAKGANMAAEFLDRAQINLGLNDYYRALEMLDLAAGFLDARKRDEHRIRYEDLSVQLAAHREAVEEVRRIHKEHIAPVDLLMEELYDRYGRGAPLLAEEEKGIMREEGGDLHIVKRSLIDTIIGHTTAAIAALTKIDPDHVGEVHRKMADRASSQEEACSDLVKRMVKFGDDYRRAPGTPDAEERAEFEVE